MGKAYSKKDFSIGGVEFELTPLSTKLTLDQMCELAVCVLEHSTSVLSQSKAVAGTGDPGAELRWWEAVGPDNLWLQLMNIHPEEGKRLTLANLDLAKKRMKETFGNGDRAVLLVSDAP